MEEKNKVAVIGAGIIGLYTAVKLRQKGFSVVVFEKNDRVGKKPCSALISERIKEHISVPDNLYQRKVTSVLVHFPKKNIELIVKPNFLHFERKKLDEFVFQLAQKAGVEFFFGKEIKEIPQGFDKVIFCTGALFSKCRNFRLGIQYFVENSEDQGIEIWPKVFTKNKYGFLWKIPGQESIEYGGIGQADRMLPELSNFLQQKNIAFDKSKVKSAIIPQGLCFSEDNNVFLLGDAAGMTKPTTGGGVIWGMTATDILINNFSDFKKAERKIKRFFKPKILKGKLEVRVGYFIGEKLPFLLPKRFPIDADLF